MGNGASKSNLSSAIEADDVENARQILKVHF